jgi:hypothetical protein
MPPHQKLEMHTAERRGDYVILSDEERTELEELKKAIPSAIERAGALFASATMKEFIQADAGAGRFIRRRKELIGERPFCGAPPHGPEPRRQSTPAELPNPRPRFTAEPSEGVAHLAASLEADAPKVYNELGAACRQPSSSSCRKADASRGR